MRWRAKEAGGVSLCETMAGDFGLDPKCNEKNHRIIKAQAGCKAGEKEQREHLSEVPRPRELKAFGCGLSQPQRGWLPPSCRIWAQWLTKNFSHLRGLTLCHVLSRSDVDAHPERHQLSSAG